MVERTIKANRVLPRRVLHPKESRWQKFLAIPSGYDTDDQTFRIRTIERNISLPVRALVIGVLFYYLFFSNWFDDVTLPREAPLAVVRIFFLVYVVMNIAAGSILLGMSQLPLQWVQMVVFTLGWVDGLFLSGLTLVTGGFDSVLFWVFLGLIIRNAIGVPIASRQIVLNLIISGCYVLAGMVDLKINEIEFNVLDQGLLDAMYPGGPENPTEPFVLRISLLLMMTLCCYGVQVLLDKQRQVDAEMREFALRREQLHATGRLAAEIAHQLKNPLGIINNAAFTLQRTVKEGKTITQQIHIIREEVERSDRIITDLMGYAKLAEGRVEKLSITEELDRALDQVFPSAVQFNVHVHRDFASALPSLLMQRGHLSEILMNLLQNSREAMNGKGNIWVSAQYGDGYSVVVTLQDDGPGIPADLVEKIFEPYFTTKEKGTGLGLAIVKHNTEIYGGKVYVESELGKGTRFTLQFPARSLMKLKR